MSPMIEFTFHEEENHIRKKRKNWIGAFLFNFNVYFNFRFFFLLKLVRARGCLVMGNGFTDVVHFARQLLKAIF